MGERLTGCVGPILMADTSKVNTLVREHALLACPPLKTLLAMARVSADGDMRDMITQACRARRH